MTAGVHQFHADRHLADGVSRTREARVIAADRGFDTVKHALLQLIGMDVLLRDGFHRAVHRQVVVAGGDDEVDLLDAPAAIHPIMVEQRAARCFDDAHALLVGGPRVH